jgi:hypothetical protein
LALLYRVLLIVCERRLIVELVGEVLIDADGIPPGTKREEGSPKRPLLW